MKKMSVYEPAMCCSTGLCGANIDPELLRISTVFERLKKRGLDVERFNLSSSPMAFMENAQINNLINDKGIDVLPVTIVDGEVIKTGSYPTNEELIKIFALPENMGD